MNKITKFTLFFAGIFALNMNAQNKEQYYDEQLKPISKAYYAQMSQNPDFLTINHTMDSKTYKIVVQREQSGRIPLDSLRALREDLKQSSNRAIGEQETMVIEYYPGKDQCNAGGSGDYLGFLENRNKNQNKKKSGTQYLLIHQRNVVLSGAAADQWKPDLNARIEQYFFPYHYPCGSVVAIFPDGSYVAYKGEYDLKYFLKQAKVK